LCATAETAKTKPETWENVIRERHRASIWLVGSDELFTELSGDT
jgi:hypothetical protein